MKPGAGFMLISATVIAAALFFAWGLRTPELDRVWRLQLELSLGKRKSLTSTERKLLASALARHPELADAFIDQKDIGIISANRDGLIENGYAYLIRRKPTPRIALELVATDVHGDKAADVEVRTAKDQKRGSVVAGTPLVVELPDDGPFPELIEVRVRAPKKRDRHAIVVRVRELP